MAFNAKNMTYEKNEPSFLRMLKSEVGGNDSGRHERPTARPRKQRTDEDLEDDEPTYVDEDSHEPVTKADYDAMLQADESLTADGGTQNPAADGESPLPSAPGASERRVEKKEAIAAIGNTNKRRLAKIIGDEDKDTNATNYQKPAKPSKKKVKRAKLSFDEE